MDNFEPLIDNFLSENGYGLSIEIPKSTGFVTGYVDEIEKIIQLSSKIIKEEFGIKGLYLGYSEDTNSDPIPGKMPTDSNLVPGFDERPPFCLELKGMAIGQDLVTSFTTPDFVKGNACKNNMFDHTYIVSIYIKISAEVSSSNCRGNARSMAKLASIMANKGTM